MRWDFWTMSPCVLLSGHSNRVSFSWPWRSFKKQCESVWSWILLQMAHSTHTQKQAIKFDYKIITNIYSNCYKAWTYFFMLIIIWMETCYLLSHSYWTEWSEIIELLNNSVFIWKCYSCIKQEIRYGWSRMKSDSWINVSFPFKTSQNIDPNSIELHYQFVCL